MKFFAKIPKKFRHISQKFYAQSPKAAENLTFLTENYFF